jgi:hypothetical protein
MRSPILAVGCLLLVACSDSQPVDCHHDVVIKTTQDLSTYGTCVSLDGNLIIEATSLVTVDLPNLTSVGGSVYIANNALTSLSLPRLLEVTGNDGSSWLPARGVVIQEGALLSLSAPVLARVGGSLSVSAQSLPGVSLPALRIVSDEIYVVGSALARLDLPNLETAGRLDIYGQNALTTLSLPALTSLNWALDIEYNNSLTSVDLPSLTTISDSDGYLGLYVSRNSALTTLHLPLLARSGRAGLFDNAALQSVTLPNLESLSGALYMELNPALERVELPTLSRVGWLTFKDNPALVALELPALTGVTGAVEMNSIGQPYPQFEMVGNRVLPQCHAEAILAQLGGFTGLASISGNDTTATCPP